jgi:hypothetical protein
MRDCHGAGGTHASEMAADCSNIGVSQHPCGCLIVASVQHDQRFHSDRWSGLMQVSNRFVESVQAIVDQRLFVAGGNSNDDRVDPGPRTAHDRSFRVGWESHTHYGSFTTGCKS